MASRFLVSGGTGNWNSTTNWSATSGGASGASFPVNGDDVFLDVNSGSTTLTINTTSACSSIDCTGFTGTLAGASAISVFGNTILSAAMTMTYTGTWTQNGTASLTSNGLSFTGNLSFSLSSSTKTLVDNWVVLGSFSLVAGNTINGNTLTISGSLTVTTGVSTGTTNFILDGTGTWSGAGTLENNLTINTSGTITFGTTILYRAGTLTYTSGTVVTTGNTFTIGTTAPILNTNGNTTGSGTTTSSTGINFNNFTCNISFTNNSALCVIGTFSMNPGGGAAPSVSSSTVYIQGTYSQTGTAALGSSLFIMNGTGSLTTSTNAIQNDFTINTSGTITFGSAITFSPSSSKTFTYTAGTVVTTGNTFTVGTACVLNTAGIIFNNFSASVQGIITNNSLLTVSGILNYTTTGVGVTFAGTTGWTCASFTCATAGLTHQFTSGLTYAITSDITITGATNASRIILKSTTGGSQAIFTLGSSATQLIGYVNATDIDSSTGQKIYSLNGTLSNATNWAQLNANLIGTGGASSYTFVN